MKLRYPIEKHTQAKLAFTLVCIGPLALIFMAYAAPVYAHQRPDLTLLLFGSAVALLMPMGVILAAVALHQRRNTFSHSSTRPYGAAAITVGLSGIFVFLFILPVMLSGREREGTSCISNVKQLELGMLMYCQDYDDHFPIAHNWNEVEYPYLKNWFIFRCPDAEDEKRTTYAMNQFVSGTNQAQILNKEQTVLQFDSIPGTNLSGLAGLFPDPPRHNESQSVGFTDGHVKSIKQGQIGILNWIPEFKKQSSQMK